MILKMFRRKTPALFGLALVLGIAVPGLAQEATPTPTPGSGTSFQRPEPRLREGGRKTVRVPGRSPTKRPSLAQAGRLKDLRVVSIAGGQAQVSLSGAPAHSIRPGDVLAGDVVREIGDGRIILARPEPGGGESTVVISIDARGQTSVRVISLRLPPARRPAPPAVK